MTETATTPPKWRPLDAVDRMFDCEADLVYLGLDLPPVDRLRRGLVALAETSPAAFRVVDSPAARWRPASRAELSWLPSTLVTRADQPGERPADSATVFDQPLDGAPFRVVVGHDWLGIRFSHALNDGHGIQSVLDAVLVGAAGRRPRRLRRVAGTTRDALALRYLARHPGTLHAAAAYQRRQAAGPRVRVPGRPLRLTNAHVTMPATGPSLRRLRDEHWPGASLAALAMSGLRTALERQGMAARPPAETLFDTRRFFPRSEDLLGNWAVGLDVAPDDPASPASTTAAMATTVAAGLPVGALAGVRVLGAAERLRARRAPRGASGPPQVVLAAPVAQARLSFSVVPHHAVHSRYPWVPTSAPTVLRACAPADHQALSIGVHDLGAVTAVNVTFDALTWAAGDVQAALDHLATDPLDVLSTREAVR